MKAYLFDLYGTLIDLHTNEEKYTLWRAMARIYSMHGAIYDARELKQEFKRLSALEKERFLPLMQKKYSDPNMPANELEIEIGVVYRQLYEQKGVEPSKELVEYTAATFRAISISYIQLYEGVLELLKEIHNRGHRVYLLSNAQALYTRPEVMSLDLLDKFDGIFYSSDAGVMKPSTHFYDALINAYGLDKKDCTMIGNEYRADCLGAHKAGIKSIYIHCESSGPNYGPIPDDGIEVGSIKDVIKYIAD